MKYLKDKDIFQISILLLLLLLSITGCNRELPDPGAYNLRCYAATYGEGIYKSSNGGKSWLPLVSNREDAKAYFKVLRLNPGNNLLYMATSGAGLWVINPDTESISDITQFMENDVSSMAFENTGGLPGPVGVYIGMRYKGVFKGDEYLTDWGQYNEGLIYHDVNVLFYHEGSLFIGTVKGLFKREQSSSEWKLVSNGIKNTNILSIGADIRGKALYAGSGAYGDKKGRFEKIPCFYVSKDHGLNWAPRDKGIPDGTSVFSIAVNPSQSGRVYMGTSEGVFFSSNSGKNWEKEEDLPAGFKAYDIKIARMKDGKYVVYAAGSHGVYMTQDDEETGWASKGYGLPKTAVTSIVLMDES